MAIIMYQAKFTTSEGNEFVAERNYAKPLGFAWRAEYVNAKDETQKAVKFGFSATREAAEKALKMPKRVKVTHSEIVEAVSVGTVPSKAKTPAKPKATKPCKAGDLVTFGLAAQAFGLTVVVSGTVEKVGRQYAYVNVKGALAPIKVAFANINTSPASPAQALAA